MHIAYVSADRGVAVAGRNGGSVHLSEFVRALVGRGTHVTVFSTLLSDGVSNDPLPCPVVDLNGDADLHELRRLMAKTLRKGGRESSVASEVYSLMLNETLAGELARQGPFDLVYERQSLWSFAGLQFARRRRLPFCLEVNAPLTAQQRDYRRLDLIEPAEAISTFLFSHADRVLLTTSALADYARTLGASRRNIRTLPCGVSASMFPASGRLAPGDSKQFVLGFVGSLKPWHGIDLMLQAFANLHAISSDYRLLIVGDGPLRRDVESFCAGYGIYRFVTLTGGVDHDEIPRYLEHMDVGLAPYPPMSTFYFSPLKVWEYAAAGVPVVASASGELPQILPHRKAALLHPPGRVAKIVKHVEKLRHDRELGRRLARRARRVARLHTWDRLAARFETIAEGLLR